MSDTKFTVKGDEEMRRRLGDIARKFPARVGRALYRRGESIMTASKEKYVPVDDGPLRASGFVEQPKVAGGRIAVRLRYGGASAPYALAVHEHPSKHDPPSWRGNRVTFKPSGRGPKYLEIPFMEAARTLPHDLAVDLRLDSSDGGGGGVSVPSVGGGGGGPSRDPATGRFVRR